MIIEVKTEHFRNSPSYLSNDECPLALAIKDKLPDSVVGVGGYDVRINDEWYSFSDNWHNAIQIKQWMELAQHGEEIETVKVKLTLF